MGRGNALLKPVPAKADLDAIELRVSPTQVGIRNMPPAAGEFESMVLPGGDQDASAAASDEVKRRAVARW